MEGIDRRIIKAKAAMIKDMARIGIFTDSLQMLYRRKDNLKPVMQTDLTFNTGNCGEACVASILEIELSGVPQLHDPDNEQDGHIYAKNLREFLSRFGLSYVDLSMSEGHRPEDFFKDCWVIATGPSPRGTEEWHRHAVVWRNGKIVHDPHLSGLGLNKIDMYGVFIEMNPEKHTAE